MEKQTEDNVVLVHNPFNALLEVEKDTSKGREVQGEAIAIVTDDTSGRERNDNEVVIDIGEGQGVTPPLPNG